MAAAQPIGVIDPKLFMVPLSDPEDLPPLRRSDHDFCTCWECTQPNLTELELLAHMPNDKDDPREAATLVPETDPEPERKTLPPGEADAEAQRRYETMIPGVAVLGDPPKTLEDSYLDRAIRVVANAGAKLAEDKEERRLQHEAVLAAILRSETSNQASWESMRAQLETWRKLSEARDADHDEKISDLRFELAALREQLGQAMARIDELEKRIPHDAAQGSAEARGQ